MTTLAVPFMPVQPARSFGTTLRIFAKETRYEFLKLLRMRTFSLATVGFPLMFYVLFGIANRGVKDGGVEMAKYMLAGYCCFGVVGASLFGIGVGMGTERAAGWLELKRTSPMPPMAYLVAKCITAQAFGLIIVTVLTLVGVFFGDVHLRPQEYLEMLGVAWLGTVPFAALGLLIALLVPPAAAAAVVNLIYLPMSFLSGLWIPLRLLPGWVQAVAPAMPTYHFVQLMLTVFGYQNHTSLLGHVLGLCGFTALALGVSWAVFQRAEQNA